MCETCCRAEKFFTVPYLSERLRNHRPSGGYRLCRNYTNISRVIIFALLDMDSSFRIGRFDTFVDDITLMTRARARAESIKDADLCSEGIK